MISPNQRPAVVIRWRYRLLLLVLIIPSLVVIAPAALFCLFAGVAVIATGANLLVGCLFLWFGLILLVCFLLLALSVPDTWKARLILAPEGITCYEVGYRVYTPWWNVRGVGSINFGLRKVSGLLLEHPATARISLQEGARQQLPALELARWLRIEYQLLPFLPQASMASRSMRPQANMMPNLIPLSNYARHWQEGDVARMIAFYAPHVFRQEEDATNPPRVQPDRYQGAWAGLLRSEPAQHLEQQGNNQGQHNEEDQSKRQTQGGKGDLHR